MGTTCTRAPRDEAEYLTQTLSGPSSRVVYLARRGAHYWAVIENFGPDAPAPGFYDTDADGSYRFALWVKCSRGDGEFCYKFVTESMGPAAYDAPKKVLQLASPINQHDPSACYALEWREKIAARKPSPRSRFKEGDVIRLASPLAFDTFSEDTFEAVDLYKDWHRRTRRVYRAKKTGSLCAVPSYLLETAELVS